MVLKRIDPLSLGTVFGVLHAIMGVIGGLFFSAFALLGMAVDQPDGPGQIFLLLFGVGAIVFLPVFYGVMGFITGAISAVVYNFVAGYVGGVELEFEEKQPLA